MQDLSFKMVKYQLPLKKKKFSILEPVNKQQTLQKIDLAIVPIVGITQDFKRIGFGKGMYDRFFAKLKYKPKIIFLQLSPCISKENIADEFDIKADEYISFNIRRKNERFNKILKELDKLNLKENATIIDFGSTKESIVKNCPQKIRKNLVASHPMAGTEYSGPSAAISDLYENKVMVVCDIEESGEEQKKIALDIFKHLKMNIKFMKSSEHDRHAAFISHMPHIVSFSIANAVLNQEDREHIVTLAAGGFRDMSRLAKSNPDMWKDIFMENKKNLLDSIEAFKKELKLAKELIEKEKWEELKNWMQKGNELHKIM
jgi:prephenate dehydrogenase